MIRGIKGKVILITGASSGIGAVTAAMPASRGARVGIAARRKDRLDGLVEAITERRGEARDYGASPFN
jgi:NADP-dependent 3-hydroxy acid dehydrogenase YdfG